MQVLNKIDNLILCSSFSVIPKKNRHKATFSHEFFQIFAQTVHETSLVPYREFYDKHIVKKEKCWGHRTRLEDMVRAMCGLFPKIAPSLPF